MLYVGVTVDHGIGTSRASGASSYLLLIFVNSCKSLRVLYNFGLILPYYTSDMAGLRPCSRQSRGVICLFVESDRAIPSGMGSVRKPPKRPAPVLHSD